jgi:predicted XRE-type DNA-binding protein
MDAIKRRRLEAKGWKFGTAKEFLQLTPDEEAYIEMKLALAEALEKKRKERHLTQKQLAEVLKTSQPRVAMIEKGDASVTLDLVVRALLALGAKPRKLAALF